MRLTFRETSPLSLQFMIYRLQSSSYLRHVEYMYLTIFVCTVASPSRRAGSPRGFALMLPARLPHTCGNGVLQVQGLSAGWISWEASRCVPRARGFCWSYIYIYIYPKGLIPVYFVFSVSACGASSSFHIWRCKGFGVDIIPFVYRRAALRSN